MKTSQKGSAVVILLALIVIVLVVLVGVYIYYQNQQSQTLVAGPSQVVTGAQSSVVTSSGTSVPKVQPTVFASSISGWKTFADPKLGYQVQYPSSWTVSRYSSGETVFLEYPYPSGTNVANKPFCLIGGFSRYQNASDAISEQNDGIAKGAVQDSVAIGSFKGIELRGLGGATAYFSDQGIWYELTMETTSKFSDVAAGCESTFKTFLSTFKLTK